MLSGDDDGDGGHFEVLKVKDPEAEERAELLKDRFRLSVISIATSEAKKVNMEVAEPVVACIADLAFKCTGGLSNPCLILLLLFKQSSSLLRRLKLSLPPIEVKVLELTDKVSHYVKWSLLICASPSSPRMASVAFTKVSETTDILKIDYENEHVIRGELGLGCIAQFLAKILFNPFFRSRKSESHWKSKQLARDVELFAHHASRKSVKMEDVILSAHRNEHLANLLRTYSQELKGKQLQNEPKKKRSSKKDDKEIRD